MRNPAKLATRRTLDDEYEVEQLNPAYSDSKEGKASHERITDLTKKIPEKDSINMRMAIFEAVIDEVIDDKIADEDGEVKTEEIEETVEPIVDNAVALHIVPSTIRPRITRLLAMKLRRRDPLVALHYKAAHFLVDAMTTMEEDCCVVSEVLDDKPADTGFDIQEETVEHEGTSPTTEGPTNRWKRDFRTMKWRMEEGEPASSESESSSDSSQDLKDAIDETDAKVDEAKEAEAEAEDTKQVEESETEKADVQVEADLPDPVEASMRFLAASAVNHRKATALVSRKISGTMLANMLHQLRNVLPDGFKRKYRVR